jgi:hypothetical protein
MFVMMITSLGDARQTDEAPRTWFNCGGPIYTNRVAVQKVNNSMA